MATLRSSLKKPKDNLNHGITCCSSIISFLATSDEHAVYGHDLMCYLSVVCAILKDTLAIIESNKALVKDEFGTDNGSGNQVIQTLLNFENEMKKIVKQNSLARHLSSISLRKVVVNPYLKILLHHTERLLAHIITFVNNNDTSSKEKKKTLKEGSPSKSSNQLKNLEAELDQQYSVSYVYWDHFIIQLEKHVGRTTYAESYLKYILGVVTMWKFVECFLTFGPEKYLVGNIRKMFESKWFYGYLTAFEAETVIKLSQHGNFLVRFSKTKSNLLAISYVPSGATSPIHTLVVATGTGFTITEVKLTGTHNEVSNNCFQTMEDVISHYADKLRGAVDFDCARMGYFHGDINGAEAERLLTGCVPGTFIIRFAQQESIKVSLVSHQRKGIEDSCCLSHLLVLSLALRPETLRSDPLQAIAQVVMDSYTFRPLYRLPSLIPRSGTPEPPAEKTPPTSPRGLSAETLEARKRFQAEYHIPIPMQLHNDVSNYGAPGAKGGRTGTLDGFTPPKTMEDFQLVNDFVDFGTVSAVTDLTPPPPPPATTTMEPQMKNNQYGYSEDGVVTYPSLETNEARPVEEDCSWNSQFQNIVDAASQLSANSTMEEKIRTYTALSNLVDDFNETAKTYAKIIIDEYPLPIEQKTLQPANIGGVGGGEKYIVRSILFKFAIDVLGHLGDETGEKAAKVAGADLRGLIAYFNCHIPGLHFPMMSLVDYKGYRVIAESVIPVSKDTLVYGSSDGGITVCNNDPHLEEKMKLAAKKLNLKPHNGFCGSYLYSATDVEGHRGRDGRHYILDFARALPPESPSSGLPKVQGGAFFRFLRPEFLRNCGVALNPDCYSKFCHPADKEVDSAEIDSATLVLVMGTIPKFAATVDAIDVVPEEIENYNLTMMVHENGIPLRYLGKISNQLRSLIWKEYFMMEMLARTVKSSIRHHMRNKTMTKATGIQHYKAVIIDILNMVLENPHIMKKDVHLQFWKDLKDSIQTKFPGGISSAHLNTSQTILQQFEKLKNPKWMLFQRTKKLLGLKFFKPSRFSRNGYFDRSSPLDVIDLKDLVPVLKQMNVSAMSQGYILKTKIMRRKEDIGIMFDMAVSKFEEALHSMPENKLVLMHLGDLYKMNNDPIQAKKFYMLSLQVDSQDAYTNYKFASFLSSIQDWEAEKYYRQALRLDPQFVWCMEEFAEFLANKGALTNVADCLREARELFETALQITEFKRASVIHNYGIFLLKFCHEPQQAEEMLWKAYQMEPSKAVYASNLKWFLENIKGDLTDIAQILQYK